MPNRILRDCTDSEKINQLDVSAERFFYRLIMVVDDYGRYYAHPGLLKARVFPFLLDKIREADISRWMAECQKAGLILLYEVASKRYLQICEFKQRLDKAKEKYPSPPAVIESLSSSGEPMAESETETNPNLETESEKNPTANADFDAFLLSFNSITGKKFKESDARKKAFRARLKQYSLEDIARAVFNCFNSDYHRENPQYLTPDFILRQDKLEMYLNYSKPKLINGTNQTLPAGRRSSIPGNTPAARIIDAGIEFGGEGFNGGTGAANT